MGETTGISWTDGTVNFWKGCTKVSPACANCYMYRDAARYGFDAKVLTRCKGIWKDLLNPKKFLPGNRYFVSSWTDFFHEAADEWREEAWATMAKRPDVTFQILTKRTERIADHLPPGWPWPNVWMGATVENQEWADKRIPELLQVPATVHFVSCEPLLGPIDFDPVWLQPSPSAAFAAGRITPDMPPWTRIGCYGLKLVITGGESGPNARPSHPDWFRSLRDQCQAAGVAFHFKSWGEWVPWATEAHYDDGIIGGDCGGPSSLSHYATKDGRTTCIARWRSDNGQTIERRVQTITSPDHWWGKEDRLQMTYLRAGAKQSGRLLDGRVWDEMPQLGS